MLCCSLDTQATFPDISRRGGDVITFLELAGSDVFSALEGAVQTVESIHLWVLWVPRAQETV